MGRLKGIPTLISPDLLHVLSSMGHGDDIVIADANFPTSSTCAKGPREIRADGHSATAVLEAILTLMPLDAYVYAPAAVMSMTDYDKRRGLPDPPPIKGDFQTLLDAAENRKVPIQELERFDFYERAQKAYAIVQTGETALYGNIILKMGVIS